MCPKPHDEPTTCDCDDHFNVMAVDTSPVCKTCGLPHATENHDWIFASLLSAVRKARGLS
jgi:hypothetical protein